MVLDALVLGPPVDLQSVGHTSEVALGDAVPTELALAPALLVETVLMGACQVCYTNTL